MDDIRDSLSKMKKKLRLTGGKRKPDGTTANPDGERTDSASSLPRPEPHVVEGEDYGREGDRDNVAGERVTSTDRLPPPAESESVSAREDDNVQGEVADVDGGDASHRHPHPHSDSEIWEEGGSSGEVEWFSFSESTPPLSPLGGEPDST